MIGREMSLLRKSCPVGIKYLSYLIVLVPGCVMPTVRLRSRGININFHAFGHGPERLVLVNGFMMTYHGWSAQLEALSGREMKEKYTTLVLDNRGVGRSSRSKPFSLACIPLTSHAQLGMQLYKRLEF